MYNLRINVEHHVLACRGPKRPRRVHRAVAAANHHWAGRELTQQLLVGAEAVGVGGIKHCYAQLPGLCQRRQTLGLRRLGPRRVGDREAWEANGLKRIHV